MPSLSRNLLLIISGFLVAETGLDVLYFLVLFLSDTNVKDLTKPQQQWSDPEFS